jgi:uncharacterized protein YdhG (YjbR/CyaY superfamily)
MNTTPKDVDGYLSALPEDARATLEDARRTIRAVAPEAAESISYGMPAFKYRGRALVYFAAAKNHCALYGMSEVIEAHQDQLAAYDTSKGTIRFLLAKPLPEALVRTLVRARMEEIEATVAAPKRSRARTPG